MVARARGECRGSSSELCRRSSVSVDASVCAGLCCSGWCSGYAATPAPPRSRHTHELRRDGTQSLANGTRPGVAVGPAESRRSAHQRTPAMHSCAPTGDWNRPRAGADAAVTRSTRDTAGWLSDSERCGSGGSQAIRHSARAWERARSGCSPSRSAARVDASGGALALSGAADWIGGARDPASTEPSSVAAAARTTHTRARGIAVTHRCPELLASPLQLFSSVPHCSITQL